MWHQLKVDDNFYNSKYWEWQSKGVDLGGKIQAEVLFQDYINENDIVLDFGCGSGTTIKNIKCREKAGFEINPYAVKYNTEVNEIKTYTELDDIPNNYFDVIISNHALEHVPTPYETLLILREKLKTGGKLIIYVPSMEDELTKLHNQNNTYDTNDRDNHLFGWNYQLLSNLVIKCKYKLIDAKTKPYSRTANSDNAYMQGGRDAFINIATKENIHPQTFVYAIKE